MSSPPERPRILSGVQPSGKLHLGNYFGAIKQHLELQDRGEAFYFIADYHALTTLKGAEEAEAGAAAKTKGLAARPARDILRDNVRDVALDYLALGLDPAKATFYRQSDILEVCELAWFLGSVTGMGLLERAHSYKDKVDRGIAASVGLFTYPVLMAADILIVRSHQVPVGKDQVQHLEMTRDMAGYFNGAYGEVFPVPREVLGGAAIVPGTDGQKMSKSYGNTIDIFAEGKALKSAVMGVVTDSTPVDAPKNPETCNAFALYKLFATGEEQDRLADLYKNPMRDAESRGGRPFGYGDAKTMLLQKIDAALAPARERRKQLARDPGYVEEVLQAGAKRAREVARVTMQLVRRAVGTADRPV
ncbi:MAG: tryptophan--tRNA ligase [Gemmataceae bacterium]|nr:tryptophan--tRNA ligase [Gemmataceae bacterium]